MKCTKCHSGWMLDEANDNFCGWCGTKLKSFEITQDTQKMPEFIYADDDTQVTLEFVIHNKGVMPVKISMPKIFIQTDK